MRSLTVLAARRGAYKPKRAEEIEEEGNQYEGQPKQQG